MRNRVLAAIVIGAIFCLGAWGVGAQLQRSNAVARPQWEYKSIGVNGPYWEEDGKQGPGNPAQELRSKFGLLGIQGWELVAISDETISQEGERGLTTYWFKRAK